MQSQAPGLRYRTMNRRLLTVLCILAVLPFVMVPLGRLFPGVFVTCLSWRLLHIPCPLCGLTRGWHALLTGHPGDAVRFNILIVPAALAFTVEFSYRAWGSLVLLPPQRAPRVARADARLHTAALVLYLVYALWFWAAPAGARSLDAVLSKSSAEDRRPLSGTFFHVSGTLPTTWDSRPRSVFPFSLEP